MIWTWPKTMMDHGASLLRFRCRRSNDMYYFDLLSVGACNTIECAQFTNTHCRDDLSLLVLGLKCSASIHLRTPGAPVTRQYASAAYAELSSFALPTIAYLAHILHDVRVSTHPKSDRCYQYNQGAPSSYLQELP